MKRIRAWGQLFILSLLAAQLIHGAETHEVRLVSSTETSSVIEGIGYRVELTFGGTPQLSLSACTEGRECARLGSFPLEGSATAVAANHLGRDAATIFEGRTVEKRQDGYHFEIRYRSPLWVSKKVLLDFHPAYFGYALSLAAADPAQKVTMIHYATRDGADGNLEYGRGEFDETFTWAPDLYNALMPQRGRSEICLSSNYGTRQESYLRGFFAGSHILPPYVAAIRSGDAWWGVGTMGVPQSRDGLRLSISRDSLAIVFEMGAVVPVGKEPLAAPRVAFFFGKEQGEIMKAYNQALRLEGLARKSSQKKWPAWWSGPLYATWGEQVYASRLAEGRLDEDHGSLYGTQENVSKWLDFAQQKHIPFKIVELEPGWQLSLGDFVPNKEHYPDLRKFIDELHARGIHVLLWIPMYEATGDLGQLAHLESDVAVAHPDWLVRRLDGRTSTRFDYTNPAVRDYIRERIHYALSSDPGCLNADGFKIDFLDSVPNPSKSAYYDPSWGVGELMDYKVMELIYRAAKDSKPDAMIDSSVMNSLFLEWQDVMRLNDDVTNSQETYWWRAWAASASGVPVIDGDDWWSMNSYFVPVTLAKAAWGFPTLFALQYRGVQGSEGPVSGWKNLASAGFPIGVSPEDYRRVSAILNVYLHAPADNTQTIEVDPKLPVASRTYTAGPLAGFYASRTFSFAHGLVAYTADSAWLMSTADTTASVPLPKGYTVLSATETDWENHPQPVQFHQNGDTLELKVRDSAKVNRYVIRYTKHGK